MNVFRFKALRGRSNKEALHVEAAEESVPFQTLNGLLGRRPRWHEVASQTSTSSYGHIQIAEPADNELGGTRWRVGFLARFPFLSFFCLCLIVGTIVGIIIILLVSDGKDVDSWDATTVNIAGDRHRWRVSVSTYIALFNFIASNAFAIMFGEAVAIYWWVDALQGQTLKNLHFRWEVGQSIFAILVRMRIWGWICVASIAFTAFSGLEALLQTASTSKTTFSSYAANMTASVAERLPAGFSGVVAATGHDVFGTVYYTPNFTEILRNYTSQSPIHFDLDGCASTSNVSCATTLMGVGFLYTCTASRSGLQTPLSTAANGTVLQPENTVFRVELGSTDWSITLDVLWQDKKGSNGLVVSNRHCTLEPASVEYPVNVTQRTVTLQPPTSTVNWTANSTDVDQSSLRVDKLLKTLPIPDYDNAIADFSLLTPGVHSTLGGIALAFARLFDSSIILKEDITNSGADVSVQGAFAAPYAQFVEGTTNDAYLNNTYASPMDELLSDIRDIMFRSSVAITEHQIPDYFWPDGSATETDAKSTTVPSQRVTQLGQYGIYHTIYKTNKVILGVAVGLMTLAILATLPLYWGFWRLGRKVSLSPLEIGKALHNSAMIDTGTGAAQSYSVLDVRDHHGRLPQYGSNLSAEELVKFLGAKKVKYGEVASNILGIGLFTDTKEARNGQLYY
ncbi:uncharacterized protein Z518_07902 [Rhinocladiella mackenziei CBS 650.93]|uniref:Uncharacterized protein n=1 Tax=Rhinocladiella mackenziei CBS 650.93 TaxID=1442369 RepID=A0A0D2GUI7_9EURO|nr:uncharacterized protein Z518_07902 [Rhinocladiella mackenziei CBS 650.93]KIX01963.1 hypothetical protein Z518_07902 [Rhinocladiella mackenziei CBS 650.93]